MWTTPRRDAGKRGGSFKPGLSDRMSRSEMAASPVRISHCLAGTSQVLTTDALGAELVSRETAYTIGIKLRKLPGALKADQAAARKEATRARPASSVKASSWQRRIRSGRSLSGRPPKRRHCCRTSQWTLICHRPLPRPPQGRARAQSRRLSRRWRYAKRADAAELAVLAQPRRRWIAPGPRRMPRGSALQCRQCPV